jgi:predicted Zn finger-like uncharacterized protein
MPLIVACPSCGGKLRVADVLLGRRVRCPACDTTFTSDVESVSPPAESRPAPHLDDFPESDWDISDIRKRMPRRDAEPHRGTLVLVLGILSLVTVMMYCLAPFGLIFGLCAWIMGQKDLGKIKSGHMDEEGRGTTQAGWICGIIGTVLNGVWTLACGTFIGITVFLDTSRPPNTTLIKAPPPMKQGGFPKPNNRPGMK